MEIVHIGMPKAASSLIKRRFFSGKETLLVVPRGRILDSLRSKDSTLLCEYLELQKSKTYENTVVSNEVFSGDSFLTNSGMEEYVSALSEALPKAKFVFVLREQESYIKSAYKYTISKGGKVPTIERWYEQHRTSILKKLDYSKQLELLAEIVGKDNIIVYPSELLKDNGIDFERVLLEKAGIRDSGTGNSVEKLKVFNQSKSDEVSIELQRRFNQYMGWLLRLEKRVVNSSRRKSNAIVGPATELGFYSFGLSAYGRMAKLIPALMPVESKVSDFRLPSQDKAALKTSNSKVEADYDLDLVGCGY